MKPQTKKWLIVGASLAVIGGAAYYFWKKKGDKNGGGLDSNDSNPSPDAQSKEVSKPDVVNSTVNAIKNIGKTITKGISGQTAKPSTGVPTGVAKRTPVNNLMVNSPEKIVGKTIYANNAGSNLYDISMKPVGKTRKDEKIGMVTSSKRTSSGDYILIGKNPIGGYFSIPSSAVYYLG